MILSNLIPLVDQHSFQDHLTAQTVIFEHCEIPHRTGLLKDFLAVAVLIARIYRWRFNIFCVALPLNIIKETVPVYSLDLNSTHK